MSLFSTTTIIFAVALSSISGVKWNSLHVKFSVLPGTGYWKMPLTLSDIEKQYKGEYIKAGKDEELNVALYTYQDDPRFFLLYDTYGNIAGVRIGYIKADLENTAKKNNLNLLYDYRNISMFKSDTAWDTYIYTATVLFVSPDKLMNGGRSSTDGVVAEGVYVTLDGGWVEVGASECAAERQGFTRQKCVPGMGRHYFYGLDKTSECKTFQPFFGLYDNGELAGFGIVPFGSHTKAKKEWYEDVNSSTAKLIISNGPQCLYDWMDYFGVSSMHFYLKENPRLIMCPLLGSLFGGNKCK